MKTVMLPLIAYLVISLASVIAPATDMYDMYNVVSWKLLVGQFVAIPVAFICFFINRYIQKKRSNEQS